MVKIKRVYEPYHKQDGRRVLVDRLWPRGLTKRKAHVDLWLKGISPSTELRKWFNHDPVKWPEFQKRYHAELKTNKASISALRDFLSDGSATIVYGAKDEEHNEAVVLQKYIEHK